MSNVTAFGARVPNYPESICCDHFVAVASGLSERIKKIQDQLAKEIYESKQNLDTQAQLIAEEGLLMINGLHNGYGKLRVEAAWDAPDHLMLQMMELNIIEFAASKTEARFAAMTDLMLNRDKNQIRSFSDFKSEVDKLTSNYNKTWLETEYNFSIATAQNSAAYMRQKSEAESVTPYVQYQTVGDDQVRDEHALLDGRVFNLNDKEAMRLYPPNGYNCRCEMIQYVGNKDKVISGKSAVKLLGDQFEGSAFNFNRADAKQVFKRSQFYTDDGEVLTKINDISYESYKNLTAWKLFKSKLKKLKIDKTIVPGNKDELFRSDGKRGKVDFMGFTDHLQRKVILKKDVFDTHTSGKYLQKGEVRHQLFPHVKSVLNDADEVWLISVSDKKYIMRYIKFFADEVLIIETEIGAKSNEIKTWYKMKTDEIDRRKGLLLKKRKV
ncbi:MAG: phage minor head protein [Urechidicola sp.]|nr:phage minor head protein [Urechidicola sp.]